MHVYTLLLSSTFSVRVEVPLLAGVQGAAEGSRREVFEAASRGSGVGGSW